MATWTASTYILTCGAILLMNSCVVDSHGLHDFPDVILEFSYTDGDAEQFREKRDANILLQEYIVVVEVNVSQVILIEQIRSSLNSMNFPLQLDSTTEISNANVTTVCVLTNPGYICRCEDLYFWPCDQCVQYGHCDNIINATCGCLSAMPIDEQFCQPITELTDITCPTVPPANTEYMIEIEIDTIDVAELHELRTLLETLHLPFVLSDFQITELNITTVCLLNNTGYQCRCEDQYFWPCTTCSAYGHCDSIINVTCGCISGFPNDGQFCQPMTELTNITTCPTPPPTVLFSESAPLAEYMIEIETDTVDVTELQELRTLLWTFSFPLLISDIKITELNITTVCFFNNTGYQCRCEDQYFWPCDKCTEYGYCDDIITNTCRCISSFPNDGQFCRPVTELTNMTACPTPLPTVPPPPTEYTAEVQINAVDAAVLNQLRYVLKDLNFPFGISGIQITELNITTVCALNSTGYQCRCEDQYLWPCDKCTAYGHCDNIVTDTCGCISGFPEDGQFCQPVTELTNMTACPTPLPTVPPPPTEYTAEVQINAVDAAVLNQLRYVLKDLNFPFGISGIQITELNITTVCALNSTGYQCRCEDQYLWPCDKCTAYGHCDNIVTDTCGCISGFPEDGQFCQPVTELTNMTACPTPLPTVPPPPTEYTAEVQINAVDAAVLNQLRYALKDLNFPFGISGIQITELNITTVCALNSTGYQCRCEDQYLWPCDKCTAYGHCDNIVTDTCGCISGFPEDGQFCQPVTELTNMTACPTPLPTVPPPPTEYTAEVQINAVDAAVLNQLRYALKDLNFPFGISGIQITELNITTVCALNSTGYQCRCEDQYLWPCDKCTAYGHCDNIVTDTCGCISGFPEDGQFCQPVTELTNMTACPTPSPTGTTAPSTTTETTFLSTTTETTTLSTTTETATPSTTTETTTPIIITETTTPSTTTETTTPSTTTETTTPSTTTETTTPIIITETTTPSTTTETTTPRTTTETTTPSTTTETTTPSTSTETTTPSTTTETTTPSTTTETTTPSTTTETTTPSTTTETTTPSTTTETTTPSTTTETTTPSTTTETATPSTTTETATSSITTETTTLSISTETTTPSITTETDTLSITTEITTLSTSTETTTPSTTTETATPSTTTETTTLSTTIETTTPNTSTETTTPSINTEAREYTRTLSLTMDKTFENSLTNQMSETYQKYSNEIKSSVDSVYQDKLTSYKSGSAKVIKFRAGSVIADITIVTTSYTIDLSAANKQLVSVLNIKGYGLNENSFAETVENGLYDQSKGDIYPGKDMTLTCNPPDSSIVDIIWSMNDIPLINSRKYQISTDRRTLTVTSTSNVDSGKYACTMTFNSIPYIIWQRMVIQPLPNVQASSSKTLNCEGLPVTLECCAHNSYTTQWGLDTPTGPLNLTGPQTGCNQYIYKDIDAKECNNSVQIRTFIWEVRDPKGNLYDTNRVKITASAKSSLCYSDQFGAGNLNDTQTGPCDKDSVGTVTAQCQYNTTDTGVWKPISDNCVLRALQELVDRAENLKVPDVQQFTNDLWVATDINSAKITESDVNVLVVVNLMKKIASVSQLFYVDQPIMRDFLQTSDVISSASAQKTWESLNNKTTTQNASSEFLQSTEDVGKRLTDESFGIITNSTELNKTSTNGPFFGTFGISSSTQIEIPEINGQTFITTIVFSTLDNVLPVRNTTYNESTTKANINADVAAVLVNNTVHNISLTFDIKNKSLGNPQCVFWNFSLLDGIGGWDSTGCELKPLNETGKFKCECHHTTSFSLLMSPFFVDSLALAFITFIGVGISMICLILALIIEIIVWKPLTRNDTAFMRHVSIVNIALSLLIADICFIIGAAIVKEGEMTPVGPCSATAFFIHFFYLALFFWMLFSALLLLHHTVLSLNIMPRSTMMAVAFALGYGAPLLIAVITVAATAGGGGYIQEQNACWLNWSKTMALLAFVIPALTIVAINFLVLIVVLYKILRRGFGSITHPDEESAFVVIARCVAILTPLFGLTWGFGIGILVSPAEGIHIVFAVLNSLQGFFILVFGILLDSKIREELAKRLKIKELMKVRNFTFNPTKTTSAGPASSSGNPESRSAYSIANGNGSSVDSSSSNSDMFTNT